MRNGLVGRRDGREAGAVSIERFIEELQAIAPRRDAPVTPDSDLVADLGFDSLAFAQLAVLLFERYQPNGAGIVADLRTHKATTVGSVFRDFVLPITDPA